MKSNIAKALCLLLVLAMALTGCNLIAIDPKMQADEDIAKIDKAYAQVVASYNGGDVTIAEVIGDFNALYNETAYMYYYYFGMEMTAEDLQLIMEDSLSNRVRSEITAARYDEANALTDAEMEQVEADAQYVYESYLADALLNVEGKTDEEKQENARVLLRQSGVDYDSLYENILTGAKRDAMEAMLRAEIAEVDEEALQAAYDEKAAEQKQSYIDGRSFESAMSSDDEIVCWQPDGYRTVKHILIMPESDISSAYNDSVYALETAQADLEFLAEELIAANDDDLQEGERTAEQIQAEIDSIEASLPDLEKAVKETEKACLEAAKAATDEIYARLEAGEDFEALIDEYGEDPGMQNEPTRSRGYYVSAGSQNWEVNFRDAAMSLAKVGDYTAEPVVSGSGVHIILYASDVKGGDVELDAVREALEAETLAALQDEHCEAVVAEWLAAAAPSYDTAAFEAVLMGE